MYTHHHITSHHIISYHITHHHITFPNDYHITIVSLSLHYSSPFCLTSSKISPSSLSHHKIVHLLTSFSLSITLWKSLTLSHIILVTSSLSLYIIHTCSPLVLHYSLSISYYWHPNISHCHHSHILSLSLFQRTYLLTSPAWGSSPRSKYNCTISTSPPITAAWSRVWGEYHSEWEKEKQIKRKKKGYLNMNKILLAKQQNKTKRNYHY